MESVKVFIGGPREETEEDIIRRIINSIYAKCYIMEKWDLDINKFKVGMLELLEVDDINALEMLQAYEKLDEATKEKLLETCTSDKPTLNVNYSEQLIFSLNQHAYRDEHLYERSNLYGLSDTELRKLIKRAKNPLEKQALQRQLNDCNYMSGKHRKGKKHRH